VVDVDGLGQPMSRQVKSSQGKDADRQTNKQTDTSRTNTTDTLTNRMHKTPHTIANTITNTNTKIKLQPTNYLIDVTDGQTHNRDQSK
jgi:hypothetical protein